MRLSPLLALLGCSLVTGCSENGTPTQASKKSAPESSQPEPGDSPAIVERDDDPGLGLPPVRSAAPDELVAEGEPVFATRCQTCHATPHASPTAGGPENPVAGAWAVTLEGIDPPALGNGLFRTTFGRRGQYASLQAATRAMLPPDDRGDDLVEALVAYQESLLCGASDFDRDTLSEAASRGWDLFRGKANCSMCHNGELFSDMAPHVVVAGADESTAAYLTPSLRGVSNTAPYFHDGSAPTLRAAVERMAAGGAPGVDGKDPIFRPVALERKEVTDLVAFLESLACRVDHPRQP